MVAGNTVQKLMESSKEMPRQHGFTLIELLFAIFIFSIVVSIVYGSYRTTFHTIHSTENSLRDVNKTRVIIERFREDLQGLIRGAGTKLQGTSNEFSGQRGDSISFFTTGCLKLSSKNSRSGPCTVTYEAELDEGSGWLNLYRSETRVLPGGEDTEAENTRRNIIGVDLREVRIQYFAEDGRESDEWSSLVEGEGTKADEKLPVLPVLVTLELLYGNTLEEPLEEVPRFQISVHLDNAENAKGEAK